MAPVDADTIRDWGRTHGWDVSEDGRLPSGLRAAFDNRDTPADEPSVEPEVDSDGPQEVRPHIPKETVADKVRALTRAATPKKTQARVATARKARSTAKKPRASVEKLVSWGWSALANAVSTVNVPVARVLGVQAPVAGMLLEDSIKGTMIDALLQPIARVGQGGEIVAALIGPPLLVAALSTPNAQASPQAQAVLTSLLKQSLRSWIDVAGPKMKEVQEREKAFHEEYGQDIDSMIAMFFSPIDGLPYHPESDG